MTLDSQETRLTTGTSTQRSVKLLTEWSTLTSHHLQLNEQQAAVISIKHSAMPATVVLIISQ